MFCTYTLVLPEVCAKCPVWLFSVALGCRAFHVCWPDVLLLLLSSLSPLCRVSTHIFPRQTMPLGNTCCSYSVLLFMVPLSLVPALALLFFYVSTFRSMCAVPNMAVFCSSLMSWFPGMLLTYFLNDITIIIMKEVSYNPQNLNRDVVSVDALPEVLKLWFQLRYAWIMPFLHCVPTGSLFTRRRNRRITIEKTCYMGSNMHLCLEFYVNIVRYIVVNILWPSANCRFYLCDETYNKTDFYLQKYISTINFSTTLRSVSFEITPTYTS